MPEIREWRDIDADWLTAALQSGGVEARVRAFEAGQVGTGQIGDCVRFKLDYERAGPDAPKTLVGKFPSDGAESRATGIQLMNYYREVKFYQLLQPQARISTPRSPRSVTWSRHVSPSKCSDASTSRPTSARTASTGTL